MFLIRLLDHIRQLPDWNSTTSVVYAEEVCGTISLYRFIADGSVASYDPSKHEIPDFLLSDSVDLQNAESRNLSLMVASEKKTKCTFQKRVAEANSEGCRITMPPFTQRELVSIKPPGMTEDEAVFRADVFGGSGRNFVNMEITSSDPLLIVESVLIEFFTEDYRSLFPNSWQNIVEVISEKLKNLTDDADTDEFLNSMFRHCTAGNSKIWASPFMKGLAAAVLADSNVTMTSALRAILGKSGYGSLFESVGHLKMIRCKTDYNLCPLLPPRSSDSKDIVKFSAYQMQTTVIKRITDISELLDGTYGLPLYDNFPLVDAIIQPNTLIQFTVAATDHKGAIAQLEQIRSQLKDKNTANHRMIFVVSRDNYSTFKYQKDLHAIRQYITTDDPLVQETKKRPLRSIKSDVDKANKRISKT